MSKRNVEVNPKCAVSRSRKLYSSDLQVSESKSGNILAAEDVRSLGFARHLVLVATAPRLRDSGGNGLSRALGFARHLVLVGSTPCLSESLWLWESNWVGFGLSVGSGDGLSSGFTLARHLVLVGSAPCIGEGLWGGLGLTLGNKGGLEEGFCDGFTLAGHFVLVGSAPCVSGGECVTLGHVVEVEITLVFAWHLVLVAAAPWCWGRGGLDGGECQDGGAENGGELHLEGCLVKVFCVGLVT